MTTRTGPGRTGWARLRLLGVAVGLVLFGLGVAKGHLTVEGTIPLDPAPSGTALPAGTGDDGVAPPPRGLHAHLVRYQVPEHEIGLRAMILLVVLGTPAMWMSLAVGALAVWRGSRAQVVHRTAPARWARACGALLLGYGITLSLVSIATAPLVRASSGWEGFRVPLPLGEVALALLSGVILRVVGRSVSPPTFTMLPEPAARTPGRA